MRLKEKNNHEALCQFSIIGFLTTSAVEIVETAGTLKPGVDIDGIVEMIDFGSGECARMLVQKPNK